MRKFTVTLTAAALVLGTMGLTASAQEQLRGAASIHALKNATPIVRLAACNGGTVFVGVVRVGSARVLPVVAAGAFPAGEPLNRKTNNKMLEGGR